MSGGRNIGMPPGPIEAGFHAAHKARKARLGGSPKASIFAPNLLILDLESQLAKVMTLNLELTQENDELRGENARLSAGLASLARPLVRWIITARARQFGISYADLIGPCKDAVFVEARQAAMHDVHHLRPDLSYPAIARLFGNRDHTTIMHGVGRHQQRIDAGTARPRPRLVVA